MKNLSLSSIISANSFSSDSAWIVALKVHVRSSVTGEIIQVIRVSNDVHQITIAGEVYEPMPFTIDIKEKHGELPAVTINIQDQAELVGPFMHRYGGAVGSDVDLMIIRATPETDTTPVVTYVEPELIEYFEVTKGAYKDYVATWTCGAENPLRRMFPMRKQEDDQCSFKYKDPNTCGYTGSKPTCDLTLDGPNGCRAHNNTLNNGSFPGIIVRSSS